MKRSTLASLALLASLFGACALPPGGAASPEEAHYAVLEARRSGDPAALWDLLHPDDRARFDAWVTAEKEAVRQIELVYPEPDRQPALAALADGRRAKLENGRALFLALAAGDPAVAGTAPEALGTFATLGARVRDVGIEGDVATIRTWGGDTFTLRQGPEGAWHATLPPEVAVAVDASLATARKNLTRVRGNIAKLAHKATAR